MKWFASAGVLSAMLVLAGCSNTTTPPSSPPVNPSSPSKLRIKVQSPGGVDVKVGEGRVEVNAPSTDVEVDRKK